jgi:hypothetical protein
VVILSKALKEVRKLRWTIPGKGKRGGSRIIYIDFMNHYKTYLLATYKKGEKEILTIDEKKQIKQLVNILKKALKEK